MQIECVHREFSTKIDRGLTSVGNHVDRLEQKITRTYSDPHSQVHVFQSTDSLSLCPINYVTRLSFTKIEERRNAKRKLADQNKKAGFQ